MKDAPVSPKELPEMPVPRARISKPPVIKPEPEPDFLTVNEAADLLRVTHTTIRYYIRVGRLPAYKACSRVRLRRSDVLALITPIESR